MWVWHEAKIEINAAERIVVSLNQAAREGKLVKKSWV